ncbi:hypothetical protein ALC56_04083 [Trachymyrmex septentrionalis]|uniref:Uncharacterized protein n=1 Tax=Trachymyrmex septentrionalis TaxID=34720 RepID=A0A151JYS2_9HYME|nr:hypothetical protein ALC56_04083 [Trachymyrmex septentrionalis]
MTQKGINPFMFLMSIKVLRRFECLVILGVFAAIIIRDGYKDKIVLGSEWIAAMNLITKEETVFSFTCHLLAAEDFFRAAEVGWAFQQLELVLVDRLP